MFVFEFILLNFMTSLHLYFIVEGLTCFIILFKKNWVMCDLIFMVNLQTISTMFERPFPHLIRCQSPSF